MANQNHTVGPWRVGEGGDRHIRVYTKHGKVVCQFGEGQDESWEQIPNAEANARLIAAAPDLLAALRYAEGWLSIRLQDVHGSGVDALERSGVDALERIRAAIAKATSNG